MWRKIVVRLGPVLVTTMALSPVAATPALAAGPPTAGPPVSTLIPAENPAVAVPQNEPGNTPPGHSYWDGRHDGRWQGRRAAHDDAWEWNGCKKGTRAAGHDDLRQHVTQRNNTNDPYERGWVDGYLRVYEIAFAQECWGDRSSVGVRG